MAVEGERLLARVEGDTVTLLDAGGAPLSKAAAGRRKRVAKDVRLLPAKGLIVDGVLTAVRPDGHPDPDALPGALAGRGKAALTYFLFDLPYFDGRDLREAPLSQRKELLARLVGRVGEKTCLRVLEHIGGSGLDFQREACRLGIPGMVSRQEDGGYLPRARWIRVSCVQPASPKAKTKPKARRVSARA